MMISLGRNCSPTSRDYAGLIDTGEIARCVAVNRVGYDKVEKATINVVGATWPEPTPK
jgi:hypothetical protein